VANYLLTLEARQALGEHIRHTVAISITSITREVHDFGALDLHSGITKRQYNFTDTNRQSETVGGKRLDHIEED
jgi:hypothetical protein